MYQTLIEYLAQHDLPACRSGNSIWTRNRYMDAQRIYHDDPILIPATWKSVRDFLGY